MLFGFSSKLLVFCERKSDGSKSFTIALLKRATRANCSCFSLKRAREGRATGAIDSLLGIKRGKAVKNCQKQGENYKFFLANHLFFVSERENHKQITPVAFFKEQQEQIALL